jgi:hypothetical protein
MFSYPQLSTTEIVISTGAKRSGEIRFSTNTADAT